MLERALGGGAIRKFELKSFSLTLPVLLDYSIAQLRACGYPMRYIVYKKLYHITPKPLRKILFSWWEGCVFETIVGQNFDDVSLIHRILASKNKNKISIYEGYFFAYHFVHNVQTEVTQDFRLAHALSKPNDEIYTHIVHTPDSVFLHVRRGDYLLDKNAYFIRLDSAYYERALRIIQESMPNAHIFIFSNDIPWCKAYFLDSLSAEVREGLAFSFVEGNDESNAIEEMELMSACKHAIIANSTFSWWAAYRIANPTKIVIAPDRITTYWDKERARVFYPPQWVLLEV